MCELVTHYLDMGFNRAVCDYFSGHGYDEAPLRDVYRTYRETYREGYRHGWEQAKINGGITRDENDKDI